METDVDQHGDYHGTDGPIFVHHADKEQLHPAQTAFYRACRSLGFPDCPDNNSPDATGVGPSISNNHDGVRFSAALGHLSQARHRLNLTIKANCVAHRILFDQKRAYGVLVESGGETFTVEGNQIVLSAGAIGSPQLLMLSGVGPEDHLSELGIPVVRKVKISKTTRRCTSLGGSMRLIQARPVQPEADFPCASLRRILSVETIYPSACRRL